MKYIIDIPEDMVKDGFVVKCEQSFCGNNRRVVANLFPYEYEEPDRKQIEDAQEEAWEFAKQVSIMKPEDKEECWGTAKYNTINLGYSYQEAKAKYDAWKTEKESKIEVGDEVMHKITKSIGIATWVDPEANYVHIVWSDGSTGNRKMDSLEKTGRHFNQVADMLKEMKEEE